MYKFANIGKFIGLILLAVILFLWVFKGSAESIQQVCPQWGTYLSADFYDVNIEYSSSDLNALQVLQAWNVSRTNWNNAAYSFLMPSDAHVRWQIYLQTSEGERWIFIYYSEKTPDLIYPMAFKTLTPSGTPFGTHPCRAWITHKSDLLSLEGAFNVR